MEPSMTFQEFLAQAHYSARPVYQRIDGGVELGEPTTKVYPAASAYIYPHHPLPVERDWAIMDLDDWRVSSVTGGSVWLVRRTQAEEGR